MLHAANNNNNNNIGLAGDLPATIITTSTDCSHLNLHSSALSVKAIYTKNRRIFDIIGICYLYFEDVIYREDDGHSKGAAPKAAASGANYRIEFFL